MFGGCFFFVSFFVILFIYLLNMIFINFKSIRKGSLLIHLILCIILHFIRTFFNSSKYVFRFFSKPYKSGEKKPKCIRIPFVLQLACIDTIHFNLNLLHCSRSTGSSDHTNFVLFFSIENNNLIHKLCGPFFPLHSHIIFP